jgi:hypothetical protein
MRVVRRALVLSIAACLLTPAGASAYTLGALDPHPNDGEGCGNVGVLYIDDEMPYQGPGPGRPSVSYVPAGGGTITSWTTGAHPKGLRVRLALVRQAENREGVFVEHRSRVHKIKRDKGYSHFKAHLRAEAGEQIALDVLNQNEIALDCFFSVKRTDFVWVANDMPTRGTLHDYLAGDGYSDSRLDLRAHLVRKRS